MTLEELKQMSPADRREHFDVFPLDYAIWLKWEGLQMVERTREERTVRDNIEAREREEELQRKVEELRQEWLKLRRQLGWQNPRAVKELGVSRPTLHNFEQGRAELDSIIIPKVKALVDKFLGRIIEVLPFENTERIYRECIEAAENRDLRMLIAPAGSSKSFTLKKFHNESYSKGFGRSVFYVPLIGLSRVGFARSLARAVGVSPEGNADEIFGSVIDTLQNDPALLIVDEANYLDVDFLNVLRQISDEAQCGLVLAGTEELFQALNGKPNLKPLHNRIVSYEQLPGELSDEEMEMALAKVFGEPVSDAVFRAVVKVTSKNIRMLIQLVKNLRRLGVDSSTLTPTVVENAAAKLISNQLGRIPKGSGLTKLRKPESAPALDRAANAG